MPVDINTQSCSIYRLVHHLLLTREHSEGLHQQRKGDFIHMHTLKFLRLRLRGERSRLHAVHPFFQT